jgi:hypothetical protein
MEKTFIDKCVDGEALPSDIDDYIDKWHHKDNKKPVYEFLGMSWEEYREWVKDGSSDIIRRIMLEHLKKRSEESKIITDEQIDMAWGSANFLGVSKRRAVNEALLRVACGFSDYVFACILFKLGLITATEHNLTKLGKEYLYEQFKEVCQDG